MLFRTAAHTQCDPHTITAVSSAATCSPHTTMLFQTATPRTLRESRSIDFFPWELWAFWSASDTLTWISLLWNHRSHRQMDWMFHLQIITAVPPSAVYWTRRLLNDLCASKRVHQHSYIITYMHTKYVQQNKRLRPSLHQQSDQFPHRCCTGDAARATHDGQSTSWWRDLLTVATVYV